MTTIPAQGLEPLVSSEEDGQACLLMADFDPSRDIQQNLRPYQSQTFGGWLKASAGEEASHFRLINGNICCVSIKRSSGEVTGLVPRPWLKFGVQRLPEWRWTTSFEDEEIHQRSASGITAPDPAKDVLHLTLRTLWDNIHANKHKLGANMGLGAKKLDQIHGPNWRYYADDIYQNMAPKAVEIMATGKFNPLELTKLRPVSTTWPQDRGIYLIIYEGVTNEIQLEINTNDRLYVGQSENIPTRDGQHQLNARAGSRSMHYRAAATPGVKRTMIPIVLFQTAHNVLAYQHRVDAAELSVVLLFRSWCPALLNPRPGADTVGSFTTDFQAARAFDSLCETTFADTKWQPIQPLLGLNWQTPIFARGSLAKVWSEWYDAGKQMRFFRSRRKLRKAESQNSRNKIYFNFCTSKNSRSIAISINNKLAEYDTLIQNFVNENIYVVIKINYYDGAYHRHPAAYWRVPELTSNPELDKLNSMAIQIQFVHPTTKKWHYQYLERTQLWAKQTTANSPLPMYSGGLIMFQILEQVDYTQNTRPSWVPQLEKSLIYHVKYRHLEQSRKVMVRSTQARDWPPSRSMEDVAALLRARFPPPSDAELNSGNFRPGFRTVVGQKPVNRKQFFSGSGNRNRCDICCSQIGRTAESLSELAVPTNVTTLEQNVLNGIYPDGDEPFDPSIDDEEHGGVDDTVNATALEE
ncbi:hypothetical protein PspLS_02793 [Pyricularia sp. CBS 133598]|nr:hypothetical protein PspLS_02793 [Pyricularia sp. CBS 133598]